MAQTSIEVNDPKAVKKFSSFLAVDSARKSYWTKKYMGGPEDSTPITRLNELESAEGEQISFDLSVQIGMQPVEGDAVLEGKETALKFYTDTVYINQMRGGVNTGGRMTRKRTLHDLRKIARNRQSDWWARVFDELFFMYLSGARGENTEFNFPTDYSGFANNSIQSPDSEHYFIVNQSAVGDLTTSDILTLATVDMVKTTAQMMGGAHDQTPQVMPIMIEGEKHYVCLMNPWQAYHLRKDTGSSEWMALQKAAASAEGSKNRLFKGGLGMYNNVILQEHEALIRFSSSSGYGCQAARALFMGEQAGCLAFGSPGSGLRFSWHEESRDNGNQVVITTSSIFGVKKVQFNGKDYGIMAIDSATNPQT